MRTRRNWFLLIALHLERLSATSIMLDPTSEIGWKDLASIFAASACAADDVDIAIEYQVVKALKPVLSFFMQLRRSSLYLRFPILNNKSVSR